MKLEVKDKKDIINALKVCIDLYKEYKSKGEIVDQFRGRISAYSDVLGLKRDIENEEFDDFIIRVSESIDGQ